MRPIDEDSAKTEIKTQGEMQRIEVLTSRRSRVLRRLWRLATQPGELLQVIGNRLSGGETTIKWDARADQLGAYSVIDTRHTPEEFDYVTRRQKEIIYPFFRAALNGSERTVLDFGCGPGRFTTDLAHMIHGQAVGTDVTARLIELAPQHPDVRFIHAREFFTEHSLRFEAIWICLVLGGIPDDKLPEIAKNIAGALNSGGLLFLIESTSEQSLGEIWRVRTITELQALFPEVALVRVGGYFDAGQEISILAGRKAK